MSKKNLIDKMKANKDNYQKKNSIKKQFENGLWNNSMLKIAVKKGQLTTTEFKNITGSDY